MNKTMNLYEVPIKIDTATQIKAIDEATQQKLPEDIPNYVIQPMLTTEAYKTVRTFKQLPRDPMEELENYCFYHFGKNCALCSEFSCCKTLLCTLHVGAAVISTCGVIDFCCIICDDCRCSRRLGCRNRWTEMLEAMNARCCPNTLPADHRLDRSCWEDCKQLCMQCSIPGISINEPWPRPRDAPVRLVMR